LCVIFLADATVSVWRRGDRQQALLVGGSTVLFVVVGTGQAISTFWGITHAPLTASFFFMGVVAAMGYELSQDLVRSAQLSDDLRESQQRMALATQAANLGVWVRDLAKDEIWATDKWRELFGFEKSERLDVDSILQRAHSKDREAVSETFRKALGGEGSYETEYRVVLPDGRMRWIASRGSVEFDATGKPVLIRGASLDITSRKQAEEAAHDLSGRLIEAQEEHQMQLARDLHDDLSQSLALLSIELEMFGQSRPAERDQMKAFSAQVTSLSLEVHRLSHELHPTTLEQLGLVAALRGFCEEFGLAHKLAIEFTDRSVPQAVPQDTALCLYRIAQEALHNVAKHSRATATRVDLVKDDGELRLTIDDDGVGFDPKATRANASLGLVSMSERARFVHGRLSVESHAGKGTRVEVQVPMNSAGELC
jgi:PAS domain S-box-containing protein